MAEDPNDGELLKTPEGVQAFVGVLEPFRGTGPTRRIVYDSEIYPKRLVPETPSLGQLIDELRDARGWKPFGDYDNQFVASADPARDHQEWEKDQLIVVDNAEMGGYRDLIIHRAIRNHNIEPYALLHYFPETGEVPARVTISYFPQEMMKPGESFAAVNEFYRLNQQ